MEADFADKMTEVMEERLSAGVTTAPPSGSGAPQVGHF